MKNQQDTASKLRELGYRLTPQRLLILSAIEDSPNHISAEEIHAQIATRFPDVNISTVYRTLELLKQLGLVAETDLGGGRVSYHPAAKGHHHHLICQQCGAVIDVDETILARLQDVLLQRYRFHAQLTHLAIRGICEKCAATRLP